MAVKSHPDMFDANGVLLKHGLCLAPEATFEFRNNNVIANMRTELLRCNNIGTFHAVDGSIHIRQEVADMVWKYIGMKGYGGLELYDFLDRTFSGGQNGIHCPPDQAE